jgi:ABC-2 type transport system permease protein
MTREAMPVAREVLRRSRRSLLLWGLALGAVSAMYIGFYPSMGGSQAMEDVIATLPEGLVTALGYDRIGTAGGWLTSTVYGLLAPILLLVFGIGSGARTIAGEEEDGTLELELTSPVGRRRIVSERLAALWVSIAFLVAVVAAVSYGLVLVLGMDVGVGEVLAGSTGLLLLVLGFATVALAVGAATGRRAVALGVASGLAVVAFILDALGPAVGAEWMTTVSPFSWYLGEDPLTNGFDWAGLALLGVVPVVAAVAALAAFDRRDVMV